MCWLAGMHMDACWEHGRGNWEHAGLPAEAADAAAYLHEQRGSHTVQFSAQQGANGQRSEETAHQDSRLCPSQAYHAIPSSWHRLRSHAGSEASQQPGTMRARWLLRCRAEAGAEQPTPTSAFCLCSLLCWSECNWVCLDTRIARLQGQRTEQAAELRRCKCDNLWITPTCQTANDSEPMPSSVKTVLSINHDTSEPT